MNATIDREEVVTEYDTNLTVTWPDSAEHLIFQRVKRRRRVSQEAGRALEILGHAIDYLADQHVYEGGPLCGSDGRVQAIQLLMEMNRRIYVECPVVPPFVERIRLFFTATRRHCSRAIQLLDVSGRN